MIGEIVNIFDEAGKSSRFEIVVKGFGDGYPLTMIITDSEEKYLRPIPREERLKALSDWRKSLEK